MVKNSFIELFLHLCMYCVYIYIIIRTYTYHMTDVSFNYYFILQSVKRLNSSEPFVAVLICVVLIVVNG